MLAAGDSISAAPTRIGSDDDELVELVVVERPGDVAELEVAEDRTSRRQDLAGSQRIEIEAREASSDRSENEGRVEFGRRIRPPRTPIGLTGPPRPTDVRGERAHLRGRA